MNNGLPEILTGGWVFVGASFVNHNIFGYGILFISSVIIYIYLIKESKGDLNVSTHKSKRYQKCKE